MHVIWVALTRVVIKSHKNSGADLGGFWSFQKPLGDWIYSRKLSTPEATNIAS